MNKEQIKESEMRRIELFEKASKDTNKVEAGKVVEMFRELIAGLQTNTKTFQMIKEKMGESNFIIFIHSFSNSFISTLYVNAGKDEQECLERLKYVDSVNGNLLVKDGDA